MEKLSRPRHKKSRRFKIIQDKKHKEYLKTLSEISHTPINKCYIDEFGSKNYSYIPNSKHYYKQFYRGKYSQCYKKQSNRKIRHCKSEIPNGWYCHKMFDFWWLMF